MKIIEELLNCQVSIACVDGSIVLGCIVKIQSNFIKVVDLDNEIHYLNVSQIARIKKGIEDSWLSSEPEQSVPKVNRPQVVVVKPKVSGQEIPAAGLTDGPYDVPSFLGGGKHDFIQKGD